jgi:flagellar motor switch protein FliM
MDCSPNVLFRFIDRLLGGSGLLPVKVREFTEVEQVLIERLAVRTMLDLQQAWQHAGTFGFRVAHLETNSQFVQLTAPNEVVIVVTLGVKIGDEAGKLTLAFPYLLLEPVMPKLNRHRYFGTSQREVSVEEGDGLQENVERVGLAVRGVLAETSISVRTLLELEAGQVLPLETPASAPALIELEGVPRFTGRLGNINRRKALRVLSTIPRGEVILDAGDKTATVYGS